VADTQNDDLGFEMLSLDQCGRFRRMLCKIIRPVLRVRNTSLANMIATSSNSVYSNSVDTIGKLDRAERRQDADIDPETAEHCPNSGPGRNRARY
jgi:hypothetical protein